MTHISLEPVDEGYQEDTPFGPRQLYRIVVDHDHGDLRGAIERNVPALNPACADSDQAAYEYEKDEVEAALAEKYGNGVSLSGRPFNHALAPDPAHLRMPEDVDPAEVEQFLNDYVHQC